MKLLLTLAITAAALLGRSALDKVLAVRGGGEAVALWAQLGSVMELVGGVALSGIGGGLIVLVAQTDDRSRRRALLGHALASGLLLAAAPACLVALAGTLVPNRLPALTIASAAVVGWLGVIAGMVNNYWMGRERRGPQLALAVLGALLTIAAAAFAPSAWLLEWLLAAQAAPALALLAAWRPRLHAEAPALGAALRRYALAGLAIGILSPLSVLLARAIVAQALSWHDAGVLQALWRLSDWICAFAGGVLSVIYLPRMGVAYPRGGLDAVVRAARRAVLLPSAALFALLFAFHEAVLGALYDASFQVSGTAVALFFAGSVVRVASWVPLFALYAMSRTGAIALGELFSLPLFVLLLALCGERLTLEAAGLAWLASYAAYAAFNYWAMRRN